ncbi:MAG: hypothetical protein IH840_07465 [Candidatus Heimdallarchaeota archaeon]|nr:hypothetical protein [Candidatus Heimdallarchaeota archaeon]
MSSSYHAETQIITLEKNELYYGWNEGSATGNLDTIVFKKITEKAAAIAEIVEGTIDIMDAQYIPGRDELSFFNGIADAFVADPTHQEISLNHLHPVYGTGKGLPGMTAASDKEAWAGALKVRTAMSHIMDRDFVADEISDGLAAPIATSMPPTATGWDSTIKPRTFDPEKAKTLLNEVGFDYADLTDVDNDGVYEDSFFEITVLSPNTNPKRNEWSGNYVFELPKIGIGVKEHVSTGWAEIIPRTFGWEGTGETLIPLYDEGGYDILFVGYGWGVDWNPLGVYDSSGRHDRTSGGNFYNFDVDEEQTPIGQLVRDYVAEIDFSLKVEIGNALHRELYTNIPIIPIIRPQSHWAYNSEIGNLDFLLLSMSAAEWELVTKGISVGEAESTNMGIAEPVTVFITITRNVTIETLLPKSTTFESSLSWMFALTLFALSVKRKSSSNGIK